MKNKKTAEFQQKYLILPILLLLFLFIFLSFLNTFGTKTKQMATHETCKKSVQIKAGIQQGIGKVISTTTEELEGAIDIAKIMVGAMAGAVSGALIPVSYFSIIGGVIGALSAEGVDFNTAQSEGLSCMTTPVLLKGDKQEIMKQMANEMYYCFDQFGRCEYQGIFGEEQEKYCFTCSILAFEKEPEITSQEFQEYLNTTIVYGENLYYSDIFAGCGSKNCHKNSENLENTFSQTLEFKKDSPYAIFFTSNEEQEDADCGISLVEYNSENLSELCTFIYMSIEKE